MLGPHSPVVEERPRAIPELPPSQPELIMEGQQPVERLSRAVFSFPKGLTLVQRQLLKMKVNDFYFPMEPHTLEDLTTKPSLPFIDLNKSLEEIDYGSAAGGWVDALFAPSVCLLSWWAIVMRLPIRLPSDFRKSFFWEGHNVLALWKLNTVSEMCLLAWNNKSYI